MPNTHESQSGHRRPVSDGRLSFEEWRKSFLSNAEQHGMLPTAQLIGDATLRLFWADGIAPTVNAMIVGSNQPKIG